MTARATCLALFLSTAMLGGCATTGAAPIAVAEVASPVPAPAAVPSAHDLLFQLFKDSDEASLKLNPLNGIFRGDLRYADQFGDGITDAYYDASRAASQRDVQALRAIDRSESQRGIVLAHQYR